MIVHLNQLVSLRFQLLDLVLQVRLGVDDLFGQMHVRFFYSEHLSQFIH